MKGSARLVVTSLVEKARGIRQANGQIQNTDQVIDRHSLQQVPMSVSLNDYSTTEGFHTSTRMGTPLSSQWLYFQPGL